jgi:V8-like Glu-specific endopeptidase
MACSCPQCTSQPGAGTTYEYESSGLEYSPPQGETAVFHPTLGRGRRVPVQGETATTAPPATLFHHTLGRGRRVPTGVASEMELVGVDERQPVANTAEVPFRWICHIESFFPDPENPGFEMQFPSAGTGTLVSPTHVLTAGHVIFNDFPLSTGGRVNLQASRVVVTPGRNGTLPPQFGTSMSFTTVVTDAWRNHLDFRFDYGLITLLDPLGDRTIPALGGPLGYWGSPSRGAGTQIVPLARAALANQPVNISGYPGDKPDGTPWRAFGRVTSTTPHAATELIYYDLDTCAGHSGSPIWLRTGETRNLVAVHTGPCIDGPDCRPRVGPVCFPDGQQVTSNRGIFITSSVMADVARWMGAAPTGLPAPGARPIVRFGSRGPVVQELQARLNMWMARTPGVGLAPLAMDGVFGAKTLAAVRAFQRSRGLQVDGVVGPLTWGALFTV